MKTKLTVTIDETLLPRAKRYARQRGVSLSGLIETALKEIGAEASRPFSERWRGGFRPAGHRDARYRTLADRYGL